MDKALAIVLLLSVLYLYYRVNRLEQEVRNGRPRSRARGSAAPAKVIPILKKDIEPGPYRRSSREQERDRKPEE